MYSAAKKAFALLQISFDLFSDEKDPTLLPDIDSLNKN